MTNQIIHKNSDRIPSHNPGGYWTSYVTSCKPRGIAIPQGAARFRVTDQAEHVTCKACLACLALDHRFGGPNYDHSSTPDGV